MEFKLTTSSGPAAIRANDTDGIRRGAYTLEDQLCAAAFRTYVR